MRESKVLVIILLVVGSIFAIASASNEKENAVKGVTYDSRSLVINGKRELLFSGSIHYPRSPPEMWEGVLRKAKKGGLNVIQTYVFWNVHEPVRGQYNFEGNYDLLKFIKMIGDQGMYATLRVGPFIEAEWNYGGFPYWLREVSNITFRTDNPPFEFYMKRFTTKIVEMMKDARLFASQGGPIILSQIENEYNSIQLAFKEPATRYIQWAGTMAAGLKTGVPWIMCKQKDAPDDVINTCNGRNCGDTFTGPNKANKPTLWTENWTAQYRVFGDPPSQRAAEDLAFSVARFFSKNGTLANYYMYYGGTNFGRTGSSFVTTRYYDEAPIDEYGYEREPKYGHLRDLHHTLRLCSRALLWGSPSVQTFGHGIEARVYEDPATKSCAAFLSNNITRTPMTVIFRGTKYFLPQHSISILPDCKTVVYNTKMIVAQHSTRSHENSGAVNNKNFQWEMFREKIPNYHNTRLRMNAPLELMSTTKDTTDYLWYTTSIDLDKSDLPFRKEVEPVLQVANLGHVMHAFVNGEYVGSAHGSNIANSFVLQRPVPLKTGFNNISLLGATFGLPDSGAYLEKRLAGVHTVNIKGLNTGTLDISMNGWGHKVGLDGERLQVFTQKGSQKVQWVKGNVTGQVLTWYKTRFDAPKGDNPMALELGTMSKGMAWVNGKSIGRYWSSYLSPLDRPSQDVYHIPRAFVKPTDNLLVLFEEMGGNPEGIRIMTVNRDVICSYMPETHPPHAKSWASKGGGMETTADDLRTKARLSCPDGKKIVQVEFASYGNPLGSCGNFVPGNCTAANSQQIVEQLCKGKSSCIVPADGEAFDKKGVLCPGIPKTLAIQARCADRSGT